MAQSKPIELFWSMPADELFERLGTNPRGLTSDQAVRRLQGYGPNRLKPSKRTDALTLFAAQFKSPLIIILLVAVGLSFFFHETIDALIIIAIVLLSSVLGFWQEKRAADAVKSLLSIVKTDASVLRDEVETNVPVEEVVPGDICLLNAGDIIPGDAAILDSKDLFVEEAALTGESYPVEKETGTLTEGRMKFQGVHDAEGNTSQRALLFAYLNAVYQTGFTTDCDDCCTRCDCGAGL